VLLPGCRGASSLASLSGFKGVCWHKRDKRWRAQIRVDRGKKYLGEFTDPKDAARAYDRAALELHGDFARTNEMLGLL
jgi:hypothetical protein